MQSNRPGGLPSGPRSRSVVRSRPDGAQVRSTDATHSRSIRSQHSIAAFPRESSRSHSHHPPPPPETRPSHRRLPQSLQYDYRSDEVSYFSRRSDDSTTTSATSSLFDRPRGTPGDSSSRTSFEDDEGTESKPSLDVRGRSLRSRRLAQGEARNSQSTSVTSTTTSGGYTVWSRVATAASELTVSVSKAWATNIATYAGEETPPGQDSRLTRAMKAYHLEKARSPADLPSWLFTPEERRPVTSSSRSTRSHRLHDDKEEYEVIELPLDAARPKPRGLRDIYDAAAATPRLLTTNNRPSARTYADVAPQPSKATDKLKALRDAKRSALQGGEAESPNQHPDTRERQKVRVGLPSGPVPRSRRG